MYEKGEPMPRDLQMAIALYGRACEGGLIQDCYNLGRRHHLGSLGIKKDTVQAGKLYQRACDGKVPDACYDLALLMQAGDGVPRDKAKAYDLLKQACAAGHAKACERSKYPQLP
jgi:TPR repeat protein